jgi:hypothetical protein
MEFVAIQLEFAITHIVVLLAKLLISIFDAIFY